ncbi:MAG: serpin family protein [Prevotella sp.]|nr:serpin family protein [Prevotella sp.]
MIPNNITSDALLRHPDYSARFSNNLLMTLIELEDKDKNIAVSPSRLQAVLVLLANWASPVIRKEILECVGDNALTIDDANMLSSKKLLTATLNDWYKQEQGDFVPVIEQQTILWAKEGLEVNRNALSQVADDFAMSLKQVNFNSPEMKGIIDKAISEATHGLIKQLNMQLTKDTLSVITDILYFKAAWEGQFEERFTDKKPFYGSNGETMVPMMIKQDDMEYAETYECQMVSLPYVCRFYDHVRFSMRIYLPKPNHSVENVLYGYIGQKHYLRTNEKEVILSLPRFTVESNIGMHKLLEELGLAFIFESGDIIPDCIKGLQIGQVIQQIKVIVDEKGTEAAAVTSMGMELGCCMPEEKPKPIIMTVDHPFIFEIAEDETNTILFTGIINNLV